MRSTTVGWLTSIVRVLPVTADHTWLNRARPEVRESIRYPIEPTQITPRKSPAIRTDTTAVRDRTGLGDMGAAGALGILQGYHSHGGKRRGDFYWQEGRRATETIASPCEFQSRS